MKHFSLSEKRIAVEFAGTAFHLSALDETWSTHLAVDKISGAELDELTTITDRIAVLLVEVEQQARILRKIYPARAEALEHQNRQMLALKEFSHETKDQWQALIEPRGGSRRLQ